MGTTELVAICGVLPSLWIWLMCSPRREAQRIKVESEPRDWRDELNWRN